MEDVTKQQTRVLRDLKTYTKYTITVFAENKAGLRGATAVTEATTKGGGDCHFCISLFAKSTRHRVKGRGLDDDPTPFLLVCVFLITY